MEFSLSNIKFDYVEKDGPVIVVTGFNANLMKERILSHFHNVPHLTLNVDDTGRYKYNELFSITLSQRQKHANLADQGVYHESWNLYYRIYINDGGTDADAARIELDELRSNTTDPRIIVVLNDGWSEDDNFKKFFLNARELHILIILVYAEPATRPLNRLYYFNNFVYNESMLSPVMQGRTNFIFKSVDGDDLLCERFARRFKRLHICPCTLHILESGIVRHGEQNNSMIVFSRETKHFTVASKNVSVDYVPTISVFSM